MELFVCGQAVRFYTPVIAADSLRYLTAHVSFVGDEWEGYTRWAHFRQGSGPDATVYDLCLNENDEITAEQGLNLTVGEWELYFTGTKGESRLTTVPAALTVKESGLIDAPLHPMPLSVAEQLDAKAELALSYVLALREAAERGDFTGKGFSPIGTFDTEEALLAAVSDPQAGDTYGVGTEAPYDYYMWDAVNGRWVNIGNIQGAKGDSGAVFTPGVDESGNLSWTNNGGLANPTTRNIRGPAGQDGATGPAGPGAYEKAVEAGYTGTEASFYSSVAAAAYHNARHLPDGADPILVKTGNLEDASVTAAKLAANAASRSFTATLTADGWTGTAAPYSQQLTVSGMLAGDRPILDLVLSGTYAADEARCEAWAGIYRAVPAADSLTVYAAGKPTVDLPVQMICVRK